MGETCSRLRSQEDESMPIAPTSPVTAGKAACYSSTSSKSFFSCVPCRGAAAVRFVTCPTCQGNGEIPRKLSVFLAVLTCLVTFSFIIFFLFPRSITVQPAGLNSSIVVFDKADIHLNMTMFYEVPSRIWDENTYKICTWLKIKVHHVLLHIQGTLTCSYLSHSEQVPFENYEYLDCRGNTSVTHLETPHPS
uniref:Transmembrane protein 106A n=1 Tax=Jaculus jaculus TaxID=51337 RepID=A0A8C5KZ97_JACJA